MTGTNCDLFRHKSSRSYLNHLVLKLYSCLVLNGIEIFTHCLCSGFQIMNFTTAENVGTVVLILKPALGKTSGHFETLPFSQQISIIFILTQKP
jgi:hypothetical protein